MTARDHDFPDAPAWTRDSDNPYLRWIYAPTSAETHAANLEVEGELPSDLEGAYVRNGPNPSVAPKGAYHWFDGDGMVHAVYFRGGKAEYRSRMLATSGRAEDLTAGSAQWPGVMGPCDAKRVPMLKDTANTDLVWHHGSLLALWYLCGEPYALDPRTLDNRGVDGFLGRAGATVSAHPKLDERTGELVWFSLNDFEPPFMTYGVLDASGKLVHQAPIDLPGARAPHDITITENYSVLHDFPFFHDPAILRAKGFRVARFHRDLPSRFGVMPRRGATSDVRWFEFEPGYALHMVNAWEEGDWIVMDGCLQPDPSIRRKPDDGPLASMLAYLRIHAHLHRWRMNLVTGETKEEALDDLNVEFCLPDTLRYGEKTRYSYHQLLPLEPYTVEFRALVKYDHESGRSTRYDYPDDWYGSEAPFAPSTQQQTEDHGYVVTLMAHADGRSECWVFDAQDVERGPRARVRIPVRVPAGFHAKWIPGNRVWTEG